MSSPPEGEDARPKLPLPGASVVPAALCILVVLALLYTLFLGRIFFLPIAIATFATLLLRPLVRGLERIRVPERVGAAIVVLAVCVVVVTALQLLADPARDLLRGAPGRLHELEGKVRTLRQPLEDVNRAAEQAERLARGGNAAEPTPVVVEGDTLSGSLATTTRSFVLEAIVALFLTYFLLASGHAFLDKMARVVRDAGLATKLRETAREIEREVTRYLVTVTIINAIEGTLIGLAAWWIGLPNPLLWGLVAMLVNYIPYLGPIGGCVAMTLTAVATIPLERAILVPLAYVVISSLEGYVITPLVVGHRLSLDPVAVFLGVLFWGWLWGVPGTLLAVPILAATKIACHRFERLAPVAALLGRPRSETPLPPA
jgi:predicted PurR-regulated permease PerM